MNQLLEALDGDGFFHNNGGEILEDKDTNKVFLSAEEGKDGPALRIRCILESVQVYHAAQTPRIKNLIAACRIAAHRHGLYRTGDPPAYLRYNAVVEPPDNRLADEACDWFDPAYAQEFWRHSTNIICLVAYVFRWKGHHYLAKFDEDYVAKYKKIPGVPENLIAQAEWEHVATSGLHAIYPHVLDKFWLDSAKDGRCANSLCLRVKVPAAGQAAFFCIYAGIGEYLTVVPKPAAAILDQIVKLRAIVAKLLLPEHRWTHAINRTLYQADVLGVTESQFSELAASVMGLNSAEGHATELSKSKSLGRVAKQSALTMSLHQMYAAGLFRSVESEALQNEVGTQVLNRIMFQDGKVDE